jgi:hypothetical protein
MSLKMAAVLLEKGVRIASSRSREHCSNTRARFIASFITTVVRVRYAATVASPL